MLKYLQELWKQWCLLRRLFPLTPFAWGPAGTLESLSTEHTHTKNESSGKRLGGAVLTTHQRWDRTWQDRWRRTKTKSWSRSGLRLGPDSSSSPGYSFIAKTGEGLSVLWGVVFLPAYMRAQSAVWYWVHLLFSLLWAGEDGRERDSGLTAIQANIASSKFLFFWFCRNAYFLFCRNAYFRRKSLLTKCFQMY